VAKLTAEAAAVQEFIKTLAREQFPPSKQAEFLFGSGSL
jgi:hypothetical protein